MKKVRLRSLCSGVLAAVLVVAFLLMGCGGGVSPPPPPPPGIRPTPTHPMDLSGPIAAVNAMISRGIRDYTDCYKLDTVGIYGAKDDKYYKVENVFGDTEYKKAKLVSLIHSMADQGCISINTYTTGEAATGTPLFNELRIPCQTGSAPKDALYPPGYTCCVWL